MNELSSQPLAPIAIFAFKRPDHLRGTLESLLANPEVSSSPVYVFCDGPRRPDEASAVEQTREVARSLAPAHTRFVMRDCNFGLRRSISEGVTDLVREFGKVIVIEDDLVISDQFIAFMNAGLDKYRDHDQVMQVSGHMFPISIPRAKEPIFLPFTTTWGWATWRRAWEKFDGAGEGYAELQSRPDLRRKFNLDGAYPYFSMLEKQRSGKVDSWGILWYLSVFMHGGLVLYPRQSLVMNKGFDGTGTNCSASSGQAGQHVGWIDISQISFSDNINIDTNSFTVIKQHLSMSKSLSHRLRRRTVDYITRLIG